MAHHNKRAYEHRAYIGLGSNLSDPQQQLHAAFQRLNNHPDVQLLASSSLYESRPAGPAQPNYVNAAAAIDTSLTAHELLDLLLDIETQQGRQRTTYWGPRTLDLDLLLYDQLVLQSPNLTLPHPRIHLRDFVLVPLLQIAPQLTLPSGDTLNQALENLDERYIIRNCSLPPSAPRKFIGKTS